MAQTPWQDLIPYYVARTLPPPQMQAFEAQLARDQDLRKEVEEWRRIAAVVWREADAAARHLPPLSPEVYQKLQYRNGAKPATPTSAPNASPRIRHTSFGRVNGSPLTLVAGFLAVFLCGGILLMSVMRQPQPEVLSTAVANSTDQGGFGGPVQPTSTPAATKCMVALGVNVPGCVSATAPAGVLEQTWTAQPRASNTPVVVRPIATSTPAPLPTMTAQGVKSQATPDPVAASLTQTMMAVYSVSTVWPDYQCAATNSSGEVLPMYARADYSEVVDYWAPGTSLPVSAAMYGFWVQVGYGRWVPTNGVTLTGPCDEMPQPTPTMVSTANDLCTLINMTQSALPIYALADAQSRIVGYFDLGVNEWVIAQTNSGWYEIEYNGVWGWVRADGVGLQGNCSFVPLPSETPAPAFTPTPGPTSVPLQTVYNPPHRAIPTAYTAFYALPDIGSSVIQMIDGGTEWNTAGVALVGGTQWVSIQMWDGRQAWVQRSMVTIVDPAQITATPTDTAAPPPGS